MDQVNIITGLLSVVASLLGCIALLLGWMGNKLYARLDEMTAMMRTIEVTLHGRVSSLSGRVARVETLTDPRRVAG